MNSKIIERVSRNNLIKYDLDANVCLRKNIYLKKLRKTMINKTLLTKNG